MVSPLYSRLNRHVETKVDEKGMNDSDEGFPAMRIRMK